MGKIRTLSQFQDALDEEMVWRIREISAFKITTKQDTAENKVFIRAGVALVYAHWEGFIKASSEAYLSFVNSRRHPYRDLKSCFAVFGLKGKLNTLADSRKSEANIAALEFIVGEMHKPANLDLSAAINTESNLSSQVFANIAASLSISLERYETKFNLIDESLVSRRNAIAHGEYIDIKADDFRVLADDVLALMRAYKNDLQNAATLELYKK
jgi:hypothetical protein